MKDPSGKKRIFSKFEDGMVYFRFSGHLPSGIITLDIYGYYQALPIYTYTLTEQIKLYVYVSWKETTQVAIYCDFAL